jgi:aminoglycoside 6'-N-acetyltransferase I
MKSMTDVHVRLAVPSDCVELGRLFQALWPDNLAEEHEKDLLPILNGHTIGTLPMVIFVAEATDGSLRGFLEVGLRSHADGCDPRHPVGFVEGWFIMEGFRGRGIGAQLLATAENWARSQRCEEMASDTWLDSTVSQLAHQALGFEIVDRCVHYRKGL